MWPLARHRESERPRQSRQSVGLLPHLPKPPNLVSLRIELGRSYQRGSVKGLVADDGDSEIRCSYGLAGVCPIDRRHAHRVGGKDYTLHYWPT
jgi:hypothetical protein